MDLLHQWSLLLEDGEFEGKIRDGERARGTSVTKYTPFWSERFQFASAVKLDSEVTCINVLPFRDHEGLSKYVAVSDERGRVYVFTRNGDVLVEFDTYSVRNCGFFGPSYSCIYNSCNSIDTPKGCSICS